MAIFLKKNGVSPRLCIEKMHTAFIIFIRSQSPSKKGATYYILGIAQGRYINQPSEKR
jgi:hypothetical protein